MVDSFIAADKAECAQREVVWRRRVYPNRVLTGRMTKAQAERELALMSAIAEDYRALAAADAGPLFAGIEAT